MAEPFRITPQTIALLRAFLAPPIAPRYGLELAHSAGLKTGTVHPILARLQQAGWVESYWEEPHEHEDKARPRRRYYRLTEDGAEAARSVVHRASPARRVSPNPQPAY